MDEHTQDRWRTGPGLLASMWRYRWLVIGATLVAGVGAFVVSSSQEPTYEATARLFLADPRQSLVFGRSSGVDPERYIPQQAERLTSRPVLERIAETLDTSPSLRSLERRLSTEGDVSLDLIEVTAAGDTPEGAAELANVAAAAYTAVTQEARVAAAQEAVTELEVAIAELDDQIAELTAQVDADAGSDDVARQQLDVIVDQRVDLASRSQQLLVDARVFGSGVDFVEIAEEPSSPASPNPTRDAILAAIVFGALASAAAYWLTANRRTVETRTEVADVLDVPLLGVLSHYDRDGDGSDLASRLELDVDVQEAYDFLLSSIEHAMATTGAKSILFTSPAPGDGKTEVSFQLAVSAMLRGRRTLLVDGDLRARALTRLVDAEGGPGLVDLAVTQSRQAKSLVTRTAILDGRASLAVLTSGSTASEGSGSLRHPGIGDGLRSLAEGHDLVLVDAAPLLATADTTVLARHVDGVVLVVRRGTDIKLLDALKERLAFVGAPTLGYVFVTPDAEELRYAYGYGAHRAGDRVSRAEAVGLDDGIETAAPAPREQPAGPRPAELRDAPAPGADGGTAPAAATPVGPRADEASNGAPVEPAPTRPAPSPDAFFQEVRSRAAGGTQPDDAGRR